MPLKSQNILLAILCPLLIPKSGFANDYLVPDSTFSTTELLFDLTNNLTVPVDPNLDTLVFKNQNEQFSFRSNIDVSNGNVNGSTPATLNRMHPYRNLEFYGSGYNQTTWTIKGRIDSLVNPPPPIDYVAIQNLKLDQTTLEIVSESTPVRPNDYI